jgi:hypothetical protein
MMCRGARWQNQNKYEVPNRRIQGEATNQRPNLVAGDPGLVCSNFSFPDPRPKTQ